MEKFPLWGKKLLGQCHAPLNAELGQTDHRTFLATDAPLDCQGAELVVKLHIKMLPMEGSQLHVLILAAPWHLSPWAYRTAPFPSA